MRTLTLEVSSRQETDRRFLRAFEGQPQGAHISFETPALLFKVLTQKRWELLSRMTGAGPMTLREVARRVGREDPIPVLADMTDNKTEFQDDVLTSSRFEQRRKFGAGER